MPRIAICDDNQILCSELEQDLTKIASVNMKRIEIVIFYSGESLIKHMESGECFDIIFLDIELGRISGVEAGHMIREQLYDDNVQIIYISAKDSYAMSLFDVRPMNFIVKPIRFNMLEKVFIKACSLVQKKEDYFTYSCNQVECRQPIRDIIYFESIEKRIRMVLRNKDVVFYGTMKMLEDNLGDNIFMNIHKSFLVNYQHIIKYEYNQVTMSNGCVLPISQGKRSKIRSIILEMRKRKSE